MHRPILGIFVTALISAGAAPALAQPSPASLPVPAESRIAELEAELARQSLIAANARQEMEALRAEIRLKDELLALGRERNAELYAIATEIGKTFVKSDDWEPFFQGERVRMETLLQSYEDRLRAARVYESTLPPSVQQRMEAELGNAPSEAPATAASPST